MRDSGSPGNVCVIWQVRVNQEEDSGAESVERCALDQENPHTAPRDTHSAEHRHQMRTNVVKEIMNTERIYILVGWGASSICCTATLISSISRLSFWAALFNYLLYLSIPWSPSLSGSLEGTTFGCTTSLDGLPENSGLHLSKRQERRSIGWQRN